MRRTLALVINILLLPTVYAQTGDFPFGKVAYKELEMTKYEADTSTVAVILNEFGKAKFTDEVNILFEYHVKIKILKKEGLDNATFVIPLYKDGNTVDKEERWLSLEATTFNRVENKIRETKFDPKNFFLEKSSDNHNLAKFSLPDVRVGSVIEVKYSTESPYIFEFHPWMFQDDIPKVRSEFWSSIPANFTYSITLNGFYKLTTNSVEGMQDCFLMPNATGRSGCVLSKYVIENLPAFKEEKYMTAKKNYISSIHYELSQIIGANGLKTNFAEGWKDVDQKLKAHEFFGVKIKRARRMLEDIVAPLVASETDDLKKAQIIYDFIKEKYTWDGVFSKYSTEDEKDIFKSGKGNSADINIALIGALQSVKLNADPVLVSTRDNGIPFKEHPQRSDFNYVISSLKVKDKYYLLDATDDFLPFGMLPLRCLNDQGRLVSKEESSWVDLKPIQKQKTSIAMELKLDTEGALKGTLKVQYFGYDAAEARRELADAGGEENYLKKKNWGGTEIGNATIENRDNLNEPLVVKMNIEAANENSNPNIIYVNPYFIDQWKSNPFKSKERLYPVDYGAPIDISYFISIELPEGVKIDESPLNSSFTLPNNGGRCLVNVTTLNKKLTLTSLITLAKSTYTSEEYHYLREFYSRIIQSQQQQFVFRK